MTFRAKFLGVSAEGRDHTLPTILIVLSIVGGIALAIWFAMWHLWTFVMAHVWPDGPQAIVNPGYWLFMGEVFLMYIVAGIIRGAK